MCKAQELCGTFFLPFSLIQVLVIVYTTIKKIGKYKLLLIDWEKLPIIKKTYDNFKTKTNAEFFQQEHDAKVRSGAFG